jgi:PAS domain S-box-containing protein
MEKPKYPFVDSHAEPVEEFEDQLILQNRALESTAEGITIADARLPDNPLIYINTGFERITGYSKRSVIGRNCRFLQGPKTDPETSDIIRQAIRENKDCTVEILNYRKDGKPFWNRLSINPVRDGQGQVTHYIGVQSDITVRKNVEDALIHAKKELEFTNQHMKHDLERAATIQQSLLPTKLPQLKHVNLAWAYHPTSELAGDTLNVIKLDEYHLGMYILDVSGHGVPAALLSVTLSYWLSPTPERSSLFVRTLGTDEYTIATPKEVAEKLNLQFPIDPETGQYFTLLYGVLDIRKNQFDFVSAGHPAPVLLPFNNNPKQLSSYGLPIGVLPEAEYKEDRVQLSKGDRLYMFTDGIIEAAKGEEEFGIQRLNKAINASRYYNLNDNLSVLTDTVKKWSGKSKFQDDISLLAFEMQQ